MDTITIPQIRGAAIALTDVLILVFIYFIPTISHLVGYPLYLCDPMRCMVLGSLLLWQNKTNTYILALTLPLFSFLLSGHPIIVKNVLISIELVSNIALFQYFASKGLKIGIGMFTSIILSKLLYYGLKYLCISIGLLSVDLISTSLIVQLIVVLIISIAFSLCYKK